MEEKQKVLVLIDADALIYQSSKEDLSESIAIIDEKINNIFQKTEADFYSMFISQGGYFRNKIDPAYKNNRKKYPTQLLWTKTLKNYLIEKYGAVAGKEVEADDLVNYFYNKNHYYHDFPELGLNPTTLEHDGDVEQIKALEDYGYKKMKVIIASPDKDLLNSVTGRHFNYTYKLENKEDLNSLLKGWWVDTPYGTNDEFLRMQMIIGDPSDGVAGIPGKGPAYWKKLMEANIADWPGILAEYIAYFGNVATAVYEFNKNYRLLKLLERDSDFYREVGYIPTFNCIRITKPEEFNIDY